MISLIRIAWRNIGRNKRRSLLSALAVAFAVAILIFAMALQQGSYADMIFNTVHARTGNLQLQHHEYWPKMNLAKRLKGAGDLLPLIDVTPGVRACTPRIQAAALVSTDTGTFGALIQGIDPDREARTSTLADVVREGRYLEADDHEGALIGATLAKNLGTAVGDEIVLIGQGADGSLAAARLTVRGTVKTGIAAIDRAAVAAHIVAIDEAFSMLGAVTEIAVLLDRDKDRPAAIAAMEQLLAERNRDDARVVPWTTLMPGIEESIKLDWYSGQIILLVLVLVVGFGIANTFLMAYLERIHEFGVLLSLGLKPSRVGFLVLAESLALTLLGVALGMAVGIPITQYFHHTGIYFGEGAEAIMAEYGMSPVIHPVISSLVLERSATIVLAVAAVLALYPAWKASRLTPVEGLRHR